MDVQSADLEQNTRRTLTVGGLCDRIPAIRAAHRLGHCLGLARAARLLLLRCAYSIVQVCAEVNLLTETLSFAVDPVGDPAMMRACTTPSSITSPTIATNSTTSHPNPRGLRRYSNNGSCWCSRWLRRSCHPRSPGGPGCPSRGGSLSNSGCPSRNTCCSRDKCWSVRSLGSW
jgi:hypothetical protein